MTFLEELHNCFAGLSGDSARAQGHVQRDASAPYVSFSSFVSSALTLAPDHSITGQAPWNVSHPPSHFQRSPGHDLPSRPGTITQHAVTYPSSSIVQKRIEFNRLDASTLDWCCDENEGMQIGEHTDGTMQIPRRYG
jgi:hypothetical protein